MHVALGRSDRHARDARDLLVREAEGIPEDDRYTLLRRQAGERLGHVSTHIREESRARGICLLSRRLVLEREGLRLAHALARDAVPAGVDHQPMEPGGELRLAAELAQARAELDERLLGRVARLLEIAHELRGDPLDAWGVALDERVERASVAVPRLRDQVHVAQLPVRLREQGQRLLLGLTHGRGGGLHGGGSLAAPVPDSLAPEAVEPLLGGRFGRPYLYEERCESTQRLLEPGVPEGAVAVCDVQTGGRGRLGRGWEASASGPPCWPTSWPRSSATTTAGARTAWRLSTRDSARATSSVGAESQSTGKRDTASRSTGAEGSRWKSPAPAGSSRAPRCCSSARRPLPAYPSDVGSTPVPGRIPSNHAHDIGRDRPRDPGPSGAPRHLDRPAVAPGPQPVPDAQVGRLAERKAQPRASAAAPLGRANPHHGPRGVDRETPAEPAPAERGRRPHVDVVQTVGLTPPAETPVPDEAVPSRRQRARGDGAESAASSEDLDAHVGPPRQLVGEGDLLAVAVAVRREDVRLGPEMAERTVDDDLAGANDVLGASVGLDLDLVAAVGDRHAAVVPRSPEENSRTGRQPSVVQELVHAGSRLENCHGDVGSLRERERDTRALPVPVAVRGDGPRANLEPVGLEGRRARHRALRRADRGAGMDHVRVLAERHRGRVPGPVDRPSPSPPLVDDGPLSVLHGHGPTP